MSQVKGKLFTCDRCGKTCFCKYLNSTDLDGGYTTSANFEKWPDGWICTDVDNKALHLCPECHKEYSALCKDFMKEAGI